ncbi:MAG: hypothetical protein EKK41_23560 [Hyphomicrobiales bacterium]|nr:MAG: hypothetical protein EKK41_23560 [Hyphomicrobiales bacterium]
MLKLSDLTFWLHQKDVERLDKMLIVLASASEPMQPKEIRSRAKEVGFKIPEVWNITDVLSKSHGLAINRGAGWEITDSGKQHLHNIGVSMTSPAAVQVSIELREALSNVSDESTRAFVEEAIKCHEAELHRSAVVMSWLAAVHVLQTHVVNNRLAEFNQEAIRVNPKWKAAKTADDLGRMKESEFLERLAAISMLGKNVKDQLQACLNLRNSAGHPNSLEFGGPSVVHHIDVLIKNVFKKF